MGGGNEQGIFGEVFCSRDDRLAQPTPVTDLSCRRWRQPPAST